MSGKSSVYRFGGRLAAESVIAAIARVGPPLTARVGPPCKGRAPIQTCAKDLVRILFRLGGCHGAVPLFLLHPGDRVSAWMSGLVSV